MAASPADSSLSQSVGIAEAVHDVVQGITLLLVTLFAVINLLVDILYAFIDPRIRRGMEEK